jgi:ribosome-associated toxin RatA of RatAB toxin-antitoxin module
MRHVEMTADLTQTPPEEAFGVLSDFERYPTLTDAVRSVDVAASGSGKVASIWEVNFRKGVLRWTEEDEFDELARTIRFTQVDGDFADFFGVWEVEPEAGGCAVRFSASFDLGMPSIGDIIDPIAEQALRDNIAKILTGLFGSSIEIHHQGDAPARDPVPATVGAS